MESDQAETQKSEDAPLHLFERWFIPIAVITMLVLGLFAGVFHA